MNCYLAVVAFTAFTADRWAYPFMAKFTPLHFVAFCIASMGYGVLLYFSCRLLNDWIWKIETATGKAVPEFRLIFYSVILYSYSYF